MSQENELLIEVDDGIATLTLNRPERKNALSVDLSNRLAEFWSEVDKDPAIRVIILTSADCGIFCAGMDLKEGAEVQAKEGVNILDKLDDPFMARMRKVEKPIKSAFGQRSTKAHAIKNAIKVPNVPEYPHPHTL